MASFNLFPRLPLRTVVRAACVVAMGAFLWATARFYMPGQGFTAFVMFGELESGRYIPELKATDYFLMPDTSGYDGQWYAQLAMRPDIGDPEMAEALDLLPYRARRILMSWTAYALGGGDPVRALHVFAVQNVVCWLALAVLLWRWFPPASWNDFLRWAGVLFGCGMCISVRGALVDGPSVLLIAAGVWLAERGRPWAAAGVLGVAGLARETNVLAVGAVMGRAGRAIRCHTCDTESHATKTIRRAGRGVVGRVLLVGLPLAVWLVTIQLWVGGSDDTGTKNFALPFAAFGRKALQTLAELRQPETRTLALGTAAVLVGLTVQWVVLVARVRPRELWWRVGIAYAALAVVLGDAVWEGFLGAAPRILLPMTLAFNVLVPRGGRWWLVLVVGNLGMVLAPHTMQPPVPREEVRGPVVWRLTEDGRAAVRPRFDESWHAPEGSGKDRWRWSSGPATLTLHNAQPFALRVNVTFEWWTTSERTVSLWEGERLRWRGQLRARERVPVTLGDVELPPGDTTWRFETDAPAIQPENGDTRWLAFSVRNLVVEVTGRAP